MPRRGLRGPVRARDGLLCERFSRPHGGAGAARRARSERAALHRGRRRRCSAPGRQRADGRARSRAERRSRRRESRHGRVSGRIHQDARRLALRLAHRDRRGRENRRHRCAELLAIVRLGGERARRPLRGGSKRRAAFDDLGGPGRRCGGRGHRPGVSTRRRLQRPGVRKARPRPVARQVERPRARRRSLRVPRRSLAFGPSARASANLTRSERSSCSADCSNARRRPIFLRPSRRRSITDFSRRSDSASAPSTSRRGCA